jgi:hypothetical protein
VHKLVVNGFPATRKLPKVILASSIGTRNTINLPPMEFRFAFVVYVNSDCTDTYGNGFVFWKLTNSYISKERDGGKSSLSKNPATVPDKHNSFSQTQKTT